MMNAGSSQHLEKIWSNLAEQEPCYLRTCSSMQISYSLQTPEPLVLNVLRLSSKISSNMSSMFMHLLHWLVIFLPGFCWDHAS